MKIIKIIGHPVLVMSLYLLILISGESFGGFYLLYILMGLPFGALHAVTALIGLCLVFFGYKVYRTKPSLLKPLLYILGISTMMIALVLFFERSNGYNDATFYQTIPLVSLMLYSLSALCFIINAFILVVKFFRHRKGAIQALSL